MSVKVKVNVEVIELDGEKYIITNFDKSQDWVRTLHAHHRAQAFAAIRRAAEVARECEATGWEQTAIGLQWAWWNKANEIRRAIRAAIGSEKA